MIITVWSATMRLLILADNNAYIGLYYLEKPTVSYIIESGKNVCFFIPDIRTFLCATRGKI